MKLIISLLFLIVAAAAAWARWVRHEWLAKFNLTRVAEVATILSVLIGVAAWLVPTPHFPGGHQDSVSVAASNVDDVQLRAGFSHLTALRLLFGRDVTIMASELSLAVTWLPSEADSKDLFGDTSRIAESRVNHAVQYADGGTQHYALVIETVPGDRDFSCHACAPAIGVALFSRKGGAWYLDNFVRHIDGVGAWGKTPLAQLTQIGPDSHGLIFYRSSMGQGITNRWFVLLALDPKKLRVILRDSLGSDTDGFSEDKDPTAYHSNGYLRFVDSGKGSYYSALVTEAGSRPRGDSYKVEPVSEQRWYDFDASKMEFVLTKTVPISESDLDPDWYP